MTDANSTDRPATSGRPPANTPETARRVALSIVALAALALAGTTLRAELVLALTGWTTGVETDRVHELTVSGALWIVLLAPMALALYHPADRVNTVLAPILFIIPYAGFAAIVESPVLPGIAPLAGLGVLALLLHPGGRDVVRFDCVRRVPLALATLLAAAAVPLAVYAGFQVANQFTTPDEHTLLAHYGVMGVAVAYVLVMGLLAITRRRDWRFAAWSAGLVAAVVGVASVQFDAPSSLGPVWGGLLVLWAVAFVAGVELWRYRGRTRQIMDWSEPGT